MKPPGSQRNAIALRYDASVTDVPRIQGIGVNAVAREIIRSAQRYGIPIHREEKLVEQLRSVPLQEPIPPSLYHQVAAVLVRHRRSGRNSRP